MSVNKFLFIGNLTRDSQVRYIGNESRAVATFDIAVNDEWRDRTTGEKREKTNYFRIKLWDTLAENAGKYLGKGSSVYVEGHIENTKYEKKGKPNMVKTLWPITCSISIPKHQAASRKPTSNAAPRP